jgi:uncharacterized protein YdaU (DUF1376 family)
MAKDPAFLFYPGDWLCGTIGMTFEQKGAYMELLMMQFTRGHMTTHMIGQVVGHHWDTLKDKFKQDDEGLWYNERLDIEKEKRKKFVNSRKNNISGENQYTKSKKIKRSSDGHMTAHMENRNENNINNIKGVYNSAKEAFDDIKQDDLYIEELRKIVLMWGIKSDIDNVLFRGINKFLAIEFEPGKEVKDTRSHLKRWLNRNIKSI